MTRPIVRLLIPMCLAGVALPIAERPASASLYLPVVVSRAPAPPERPPSPPPPHVGTSRVLGHTPLPPGWRLAFFEARPDGVPPEAVAEYVAEGGDVEALGAWYRDALPPRGWRLAAVSQSGQRWERGSEWLGVQWRDAGDGARLSLTRDGAAVAPVQGLSLTDGVPLPSGTTRLRYDRLDVLTEEVVMAAAADDAVVALRRVLEGSRWRLGPSRETSEGIVTVFEGPAGRLTTAVRPGASGSIIGLGLAPCDLLSVEPGDLESVYLDGVPAPPYCRLVGYDRDGEEGAEERWSAPCADLDLVAEGLARRWSARDWRVADRRSERRSGALVVTVDPAAGGSLDVSARAVVPDGWQGGAGTGAVDVALSREKAERRPTSGLSLLWPDVAVPPGSDAVSLDMDPGAAWPVVETYQVEGRSWLAWFRVALPGLGWEHERDVRTDEAELGVFFAGGEELRIGAPVARPDRLTVARRRVCDIGEPVIATEPGAPARHLAEMPVYPGAGFTDYRDPDERYSLTCSGMDELAAWYRDAMERGDWALAVTVGPEDRFERTLHFVRPGERHLPPEQRTAWGEVVLRRVWPYHYEIVLRRDPTGVRPFASAP